MLDTLASYKKQIDTSLIQFLEVQKQELTSVNSWAADSIDRLQSFCVAGKSIRGSLVLWAQNAYGGVGDDGLFAAVAIELYHSGLLIHDDIMDADIMRRGKESLWAQYAAEASSRHPGLSPEFGKNMAVCVGDLAFFLAQQRLCAFSGSTAFADVYRMFSEEFSRVCIAQMEDVSFGVFPQIPSGESVSSLYTEKTGRYTFSLPLTIGSRLARAPEIDVPVLTQLGSICGLLFQIKDDELNLFGDPGHTGKPVGSDIREAKKTLYISRLYEKATAIDREKLVSLLSVQPLTDSSKETVYGLLASYGIRQLLDDHMKQLIGEAEVLTEKLHIAQTHKKELQSFVAFVYGRDH